MPYKDKERQKEYQREWCAKRRAEFFSNKSCIECGSTDQLELDHIDPKTKVSHSIWSWSDSRREAELAKCQILCKEHHLSKSVAYFRELYTDKEHGLNMYKRQGCKCDVCKHAKKIENAKRYNHAGVD